MVLPQYVYTYRVFNAISHELVSPNDVLRVLHWVEG